MRAEKKTAARRSGIGSALGGDISWYAGDDPIWGNPGADGLNDGPRWHGASVVLGSISEFFGVGGYGVVRNLTQVLGHMLADAMAIWKPPTDRLYIDPIGQARMQRRSLWWRSLGWRSLSGLVGFTASVFYLF